MKYQRVKGGRCSLLTLLAIMSTKLRIIPVIMAHTWYVTVSSTSQRIPFPENELRLIPSLREDTVTILNMYIYLGSLLILRYVRSVKNFLPSDRDWG